MILRMIVARSPSSDWKLWTGNPSSVRLWRPWHWRPPTSSFDAARFCSVLYKKTKPCGHGPQVRQNDQGGTAMTVAADVGRASMPWWREPTKDQWMAWIAAWLGWTLDAFDFTIFLLIMLPISQE